MEKIIEILAMANAKALETVVNANLQAALQITQMGARLKEEAKSEPARDEEIRQEEEPKQEQDARQEEPKGKKAKSDSKKARKAEAEQETPAKASDSHPVEPEEDDRAIMPNPPEKPLERADKPKEREGQEVEQGSISRDDMKKKILAYSKEAPENIKKMKKLMQEMGFEKISEMNNQQLAELLEKVGAAT